MAEITTTEAFRQALSSLSLDQQRIVSAAFVGDVLDLTDDDRVLQAQKVAADPDAPPDALMSAYHSVWHASIESSMSSGMELIDWKKQAAHFVARACAESLTPAHQGITWRHLALNVANHCRMARLCSSIEHEQTRPELSTAEEVLHKQIQTQFDILAAFLSTA